MSGVKIAKGEYIDGVDLQTEPKDVYDAYSKLF